MASPIQVVLNQENFEQAREVVGGGPKKDFFAERDEAYVRHKRSMQDQLEGLAVALEGQPQGQLGIVKVILRRDAWAKSHRPLRALFKAEITPLVGGGDLGEMYVEARPGGLRLIAQAVRGTEEHTNLRPDNNGKLIPHPSAGRSETGALDRLELYSAADRRKFSVDEAMDWLSNPMTGSNYRVELFDIPPPHSQWDAVDEGRQRLYASFIEGLAAIGHGLNVERVQTVGRDQPQLALRLTKAEGPPLVLLQRSAQDRKRDREVAPFETDKGRHQSLLAFLDHHPLVRRIELPPVLTRTIIGERMSAQSMAGTGRAIPTSGDLLARDPAANYPRLGIIDGGISDAAAEWVLDRWEPLADEHADRAHGTFIAGLAVGGNALNGSVCPEPDGIDLVDIAVFPDDDQPAAFEQYYPGGLDDFFDEIDNAVADAKARHDVRVFNFSLNVQHPAEPDQYSSTAARLDGIAETNDSVFFISAGNTSPQGARTEWPADETQALVALATARGDGLLVPAESVRNVSVAALNPPDCASSISHMPARYSRRGPGLRAGVKPDLAHFGGSGSPQAPFGHGLFSILPDGSIIDGCGTSYAAPLIAKTAAVLDQNIEGQVSRETLIGLLLHHAEMPEALRTKALSGVARDLVGFGMPPAARQILEGDEHKITLVFASRLRVDQQISFGFAWPPSLVTPDGKCRGSAKLTLVSTPPLDRRFGSEFVRVNIDATLQQENFDKDGKQSWHGRLDPIYLPDRKNGPAIEAERIEHGLKWSPVKCLSKTMPRGIGNSTNWRLFMKYLTRAGEQMPDDGVPFTVLLTISDPQGEAPVFNDVRALLTRTGVRVEDIRTAARITTRV
ncbi:MAG: S8 family peptidase [Brevundimonas sp.]|uniref:S8 family peptidase n=1 Tax=Brevundimonas sp. TaxID=1871086 RepID=UPI0025C188F5|nr:S8 family peptidase [Brevundimonas sp.]MBX3476286.1 S8 family peptidase [Brevundimonas sp.]